MFTCLLRSPRKLSTVPAATMAGQAQLRPVHVQLVSKGIESFRPAIVGSLFHSDLTRGLGHLPLSISGLNLGFECVVRTTLSS